MIMAYNPWRERAATAGRPTDGAAPIASHSPLRTPRLAGMSAVTLAARLVAEADAADVVDLKVSVDSTDNRTHQHATNMGRRQRPSGRSQAGIHTGG